jgi:RimJ/RimL family protein N-acetyltransferase
LPLDRLRLRLWRDDDVEAFHRIWGDPDVVFWGPARDLEASRAMLARVRARCEGLPSPVGWHAIVEATTGEAVGNVLLQPAPFAPGELEVGWHLRRDRWGRGYATEAARMLMARALESPAPARLVCAILPSNDRSRRVAERLGFAREARDVLHGGLLHDVWAIDRARFAAVRSSSVGPPRGA